MTDTAYEAMRRAHSPEGLLAKIAALTDVQKRELDAAIDGLIGHDEPNEWRMCGCTGACLKANKIRGQEVPNPQYRGACGSVPQYVSSMLGEIDRLKRSERWLNERAGFDGDEA